MAREGALDPIPGLEAAQALVRLGIPQVPALEIGVGAQIVGVVTVQDIHKCVQGEPAVGRMLVQGPEQRMPRVGEITRPSYRLTAQGRHEVELVPLGIVAPGLVEALHAPGVGQLEPIPRA